MCKTKQGSKLVDILGNNGVVLFRDVNDNFYHMSKNSILAILADYVFEVDQGVIDVLHSPEYWLPKGEDIV